MKTLATVVLIATLLSSIDAGVVDDSCRTPNNTAGICTEFPKCKLIVDLYKLRVKPQWVQNYLRKCSCGSFVGKVPVVCCHSDEEVPLERHRNRHLINSADCGYSVGDKIINGQMTNLGEFPWMAVLLYQENNKLSEKCGGTLISDKFVLTAAHCIKSSLKQVRLGEHDLSSDPDCEMYFGSDPVCSLPVQNIDVKRMVKHPHYVFNRRIPKIINDIALIELKSPVVLNENVKTICLPLEESNLHGRSMTVAGWGATENATSNHVMLKAQVPMVSLDACNRAYSKLGVRTTIIDTQLCAGGADTTDTCSGDSGGPLKGFPPGSENMVQYGIVSYGPSRCATPGVPAVYTNIVKYMSWILDNIKK